MWWKKKKYQTRIVAGVKDNDSDDEDDVTSVASQPEQARNRWSFFHIYNHTIYIILYRTYIDFVVDEFIF